MLSQTSLCLSVSFTSAQHYLCFSHDIHNDRILALKMKSLEWGCGSVFSCNWNLYFEEHSLSKSISVTLTWSNLWVYPKQNQHCQVSFHSILMVLSSKAKQNSVALTLSDEPLKRKWHQTQHQNVPLRRKNLSSLFSAAPQSHTHICLNFSHWDVKRLN